MAKTRLAPLGWKKGPFLTVRPASKKNRSKRKPKPLKARKFKVKRPKPAGDYQQRNRVLRSMGFRDYTEYLASDLWRTIRRMVLLRDSHRCRACDSQAAEVHHQAYTERVLRGEDLTPLYSLCRDCHEHIEFSENKKIMKLQSVEARLNSMIGRRYAAKRQAIQA